MKKPARITLLMMLTLFTLSQQARPQTAAQAGKSEKQAQSDSAFFSALVAQYTSSVNNADTVAASAIWAKTADVSYFSFAGTYYGWDGVKQLYQLLKDSYSSRKLTFFNLKYFYSREISWVTFLVVFDATPAKGGKAVQTRGRETQIWKKVSHEWRLVHVHYSAMPPE